MQAKAPLGPAGKHWVALVLSGVGGFVDVVSYIVLAQVFTANMSGNSIHIGQFAADLNSRELMAPAVAVASYAFGLVVGRVMIEIGARRKIDSIATFTLTLESVFLVTAVFLGNRFVVYGSVPAWHPVRYVLIALLAIAMAIQTATLTRVGPLTVYTTFVTGTLTKFAQRFSIWIFRAYDEREYSLAAVFHDKEFRHSVFLLAVWVTYVLGAIGGALIKKRFELRSLWIAIAAVIAVILIDLRRPLSLEEEKE